MIYLDTSALAKLLMVEPETAALRSWLADRADYPVTSALGRVELIRAVVRQGQPGQVERAGRLLDAVDIMPMSEAVLALAETVGPPTLRSLDAIHLASAVRLGAELTAVVAYDHRLLDGCRQVGLSAASPGA